MSPFPNHSQNRADELREQVRVLIGHVRAGKPLVNAEGFQIRLLHDMSSNIDRLALDASRWEMICRDRGWDPTQDPWIKGEVKYLPEGSTQ